MQCAESERHYDGEETKTTKCWAGVRMTMPLGDETGSPAGGSARARGMRITMPLGDGTPAGGPVCAVLGVLRGGDSIEILGFKAPPPWIDNEASALVMLS